MYTILVIAIMILITLVIYLWFRYGCQEYYLAEIIQTTQGYDVHHTYHYFFDVKFDRDNQQLSQRLNGSYLIGATEVKRIEVSFSIYSAFKSGDNILIKA